jgi:microcystin-dependent protein
MAQPYVGEIRLFAGNFAPLGWMFCDGQLLAIAENETLFQLIGTTFGGDGQSTFALPELRGRVPIHMGQKSGLSNRILGQLGGSETTVLLANQLPPHLHVAVGSSAPGDSDDPTGRTWAASAALQFIVDGGAGFPNANSSMNPASLGATGGGQPHNNMMPYVGVNYIISLFGIFPSQG